MRNIKLTVSYDGSRYHGFQSQPERNTIQDKLEEAIDRLTSQDAKLTSSGRTDAGVHARAHVVNFLTESTIPIQRWCLALNNYLPPDIVVTDAQDVPETFHAQFDAVSKTYRYTINNSRFRDVIMQRTQFHYYGNLDVVAMEQAMHHLVGKHDFTSFCSTKSTKDSHVRTIHELKIEQQFAEFVSRNSDRPNLLHFYFTGDGFLYHMIRIIMGTLLQIGAGKRSSSDMLRILQARDRSKAGPTAMAHGLTLWEVRYDS